MMKRPKSRLKKYLSKLNHSYLKRLYQSLKATPKIICLCLKHCFRLLCKIPKILFSCLKGFAMVMLCGILMITLTNSLNSLPGPRIHSRQMKKDLPPLIMSKEYDYKRSMVRLYAHDQFFCSGVVVGQNYLLTASHCLVDEDGQMRDEEITVKNYDGSVVVKAQPAGVNLRMDWGLVQGNFSDIPGAMVAETGDTHRNVVLACGYPQGSAALNCQALRPMMNDAFLIKCAVGGMLFPGMSGGPVFDVDGVLVGLNVLVYPAGEGGGVAYTPTLAILANFGITNN